MTILRLKTCFWIPPSSRHLSTIILKYAAEFYGTEIKDSNDNIEVKNTFSDTIILKYIGKIL